MSEEHPEGKTETDAEKEKRKVGCCRASAVQGAGVR